MSDKERKTFQQIAKKMGKTAAMNATAALTSPPPPTPEAERNPELPAPKHCPFCGKPPMTMWRKGTLVPFVYCLTVGCITYGNPKMAMRLDVWNSRVIQIDERTMKLAQIGDALLRFSQTDINDNHRIKELLNEVASSQQLRGRGVAYDHERQRWEDAQRQSHHQQQAERFAQNIKWKP